MGLIVVLVLCFSLALAWILFFFINIKIVRRLKKNPITKDAMGFHLIWGWYALNISEALFFSREWVTKRRGCSHGFMFADYELIHQYTTPFEKLICKTFVILGLSSVIGILISGLLLKMGFNILDY